MDIKISIGFGRRGQHSMRVQNQNLETQVQVLTGALTKVNEENKELKEQLSEALRERVAKGHRMTSQGLRLVKGPVVRAVEGVPNRYQITEGDEGA
jgi:hypothetical protein